MTAEIRTPDQTAALARVMGDAATVAAQQDAPAYPGATTERRSFAVCRHCGFTDSRHASGCSQGRPLPWDVPEFPTELAPIFDAASTDDMGRILRSQRLGYGYLGSDFDSAAAGHVSAAMCHLHCAMNRAETPAQREYHQQLAAGYVRLALVEAGLA